MPSLFINLKACSKKKGYFPFAASINTTSYLLCNVGKTSTASPIITFIFSSAPTFLMFSIASFKTSNPTTKYAITYIAIFII